MNIILRPLTKENYNECLQLQLADDQRDLVASNVQSIADSKLYPELIPLTIYHEDTLVGFIMYNDEPQNGEYWIIRLMIDHHHQGKGYGRAAMVQLIAMLKERPGCKAIKISYEPENITAERLYESLGFQKTGEMLDGELVAKTS